MNCRQLSDGGTVSVRNAALAPCIEALVTEAELGPDNAEPDPGHEFRVAMPWSCHGHGLYQRPVYISSADSFIAARRAFRHIVGVAKNVEFGQRLKQAIKASSYRSARRFAVDAMGWPENGGPQRLQNYISGRVPDNKTLAIMCDRLGVSRVDLLGYDPSEEDAEAHSVLRHLLEIAGIAPDQADTIASAALEARELLRGFPEDEALDSRARFAAHAAWRQIHSPGLGR